MISILIVTHFSLGDSYRQIMKHFFGDSVPETFVIGSNTLDTQDSLLPKIQQVIERIPEDQPILILTDIFGATPCNVLNYIEASRSISVIAGINICMLVKAVQDANKYDDVAEFAQEVVKTAKKGIITYSLNKSPT
ncbi:MAG: hypothetical protein GKC53_04685 [Neisseriaceae bacterium]|nr:MAG: hypothetical protein GKC53_04685 [Neisseriaceae bacterium]